MGAKYNFALTGAYGSYGSYGSTGRILKFFADVALLTPALTSYTLRFCLPANESGCHQLIVTVDIAKAEDASSKRLALQLIPVSILVDLNSNLPKYWLVQSILGVNTGDIQCYFLTPTSDHTMSYKILDQHM